MKSFFENKIAYNQISFCLTNKPTIDEREIHSYHEILLYFDGDAELFTTDGHRLLKKPSILVIPKETYHFLKPGSISCFTRLKISIHGHAAADTPLKELLHRLEIFEPNSEEMQTVCDKLYAILKTNPKNAAFYAYATLMMLIAELDRCETRANREIPPAQNSPIAGITEYISQNLHQNLDIKTLSKMLHISPSGVTHLFKKEYGIPMHRYILQKRLVHAKRLIKEGEPLTKIYADVGFRDYSSFYKAYVNYFGRTPSVDKQKANEKHR